LYYAPGKKSTIDALRLLRRASPSYNELYEKQYEKRGQTAAAADFM